MSSALAWVWEARRGGKIGTTYYNVFALHGVLIFAPEYMPGQHRCLPCPAVPLNHLLLKPRFEQVDEEVELLHEYSIK